MAISVTRAAAFLLGCTLVLSGCGGGKPDESSADKTAGSAADTTASTGRAGAAFDPAGSDAKAIAVADRVLNALGGPEAWAATHNLVFTFAVARGDTELTRRTHYWDRVSDRHRVEYKDRENRSFVIVHAFGDSMPSLAAMDGQPVADPAELRRLKERAYAMWVNDTYWLLMPYKLKDPGVHLAYDGEKSENGRTWDVIELSFDHVGLTPGDHYWAYVNRETGLMDRWAFRLESMPPDAEPPAFAWMNWRPYGRILLSDARVLVGGDQRIFFPNLAVFDDLPGSVFSSTATPSLPTL